MPDGVIGLTPQLQRDSREMMTPKPVGDGQIGYAEAPLKGRKRWSF